MKNQKFTFVVIIAIIGFTTLAFAVSDNSNLVKIVHNGKVIEVAPAAVNAHLAHGDTLENAGSSSAS